MNVARVTICIPIEVRKKMLKHKNINWSAVCSNAIKKKLRMGASTPEEVLERIEQLIEEK